ncbi:MAG: EamA family transporter [Candidatus Eisenbacteria bacterium]
MSPTLKNLLMIVFCIGTGSAGQLVMKHGMNTVGKINAAQILSKMSVAFLNPYVIGGLLLYGISAIVWMIVLSRVDLSFAYPMVSLGYVFVVVSSKYIFDERVTALRLIGTLVICLGVFLISRSAS